MSSIQEDDILDGQVDGDDLSDIDEEQEAALLGDDDEDFNSNYDFSASQPNEDDFLDLQADNDDSALINETVESETLDSSNQVHHENSFNNISQDDSYTQKRKDDKEDEEDDEDEENDEDEEDDDDDDEDGRGRFKSERVYIPTVATNKVVRDIPDSLDQVELDEESKAQIQRQNNRNFHPRNRQPHQRGRNFQHRQNNSSNGPNMQPRHTKPEEQEPQQHVDLFQKPTKILINPKFKGPLMAENIDREFRKRQMLRKAHDDAQNMSRMPARPMQMDYREPSPRPMQMDYREPSPRPMHMDYRGPPANMEHHGPPMHHQQQMQGPPHQYRPPMQQFNRPPQYNNDYWPEQLPPNYNNNFGNMPPRPHFQHPMQQQHRGMGHFGPRPPPPMTTSRPMRYDEPHFRPMMNRPPQHQQHQQQRWRPPPQDRYPNGMQPHQRSQNFGNNNSRYPMPPPRHGRPMGNCPPVTSNDNFHSERSLNMQSFNNPMPQQSVPISQQSSRNVKPKQHPQQHKAAVRATKPAQPVAKVTKQAMIAQKATAVKPVPSAKSDNEVKQTPVKPKPSTDNSNEDEATRELRLKIEEQKKMREAFLQKKEARRKQQAAARLAQIKGQSVDTQETPSIETTKNPVKNRVGKRKIEPPMANECPTVKVLPTVGAVGTVQASRAAVQTNISHPKPAVKTVGNVKMPNQNLRTIKTTGQTVPQPQMPQNNTRTQLNKPRMASNLRGPQNAVRPRMMQNVARSTITPNNANLRAAVPNVLKIVPTQGLPKRMPLSMQGASPPIVMNQPVLASQNGKVEIGDLASTTSSHALNKLCSSIGPIIKIEQNPAKKTANVIFKSIAHAKQFCLKYDRYMMDLSVIKVRMVNH